jgi:hypothetical protein
MSSQFKKIQTAEELEKALLYIRAEQKATERNIRNEADRLLESLKPINLINRVIPRNTWADAGLSLVRGIRKYVTAPEPKKTVRKRQKKVEAVPEEDQNNSL